MNISHLILAAFLTISVATPPVAQAEPPPPPSEKQSGNKTAEKNDKPKTTIDAPTLVCRSDGKAPNGDKDCASKGGLVMITGFQSDNYDQCLSRSEIVDRHAPHYTPWQVEKTSGDKASETESKTGSSSWGVADPIKDNVSGTTKDELDARKKYCREVFPAVNNVDSDKSAAALTGHYTKVAILLDNAENCVKNLKSGAEIPLNDEIWKGQTPEEFCKAKESQLKSGKYRSRWDQVGGGWTTGWVPNHDDAVCVNGLNCNCEPNACGTFKKGESTFVWPQGCGGPKWTIKCDSEPEEGPANGKRGGTFHRTEEVPYEHNSQSCPGLSVDEGLSCPKVGDICSRPRGNAISSALFIDLFECR